LHSLNINNPTRRKNNENKNDQSPCDCVREGIFGKIGDRIKEFDGVQLLESKGMKVSELKRAQEIAEEEVALLKAKWHEYFD